MIWQCSGMALHYDHKPGAEQAHAAHHYFHKVAAELTDALLTDMTATQYLVQDPLKKDLALRLWKLPDAHYELGTLVTWVERAMRLVTGFDPDVSTWLEEVLECPTLAPFLIEVLENKRAFTQDEQVICSIGIEAGRTVLLSTSNVIIVELDTGLHGMAVHGKGSWLLDKLDEAWVERLPRSHA